MANRFRSFCKVVQSVCLVICLYRIASSVNNLISEENFQRASLVIPLATYRKKIVGYLTPERSPPRPSVFCMTSSDSVYHSVFDVGEAEWAEVGHR